MTDVLGWGFACSGLLSIEEIRATAAEAEDLGYSSLWVTVLRARTNPSEVLFSALEATEKIEIGLGLIPLDAFPAAGIAPELAAAPPRAIIGLGVGEHTNDAAAFWESEASAFRALAPRVRIAVGSYGPRVLKAAGAYADAVLLNWMTSEIVGWALRQVDAGAQASGRRRPRPVYVYVPTAVGADAAGHLARALGGLGTKEYHRRHQEAVGDITQLGVRLDLATSMAPKLPTFGSEAVSVISPTGATTESERRQILRACRPADMTSVRR